MSYRMFDYLVPNVNFFGPNAISVVGERCQLLGGKKALLVTDKGLRAIKDGAVDKTLHYLREAGIEVAIFDGVEPNPKDTNVRDGLSVFRREQCDIIVTVGGGSPHDCGKGIGIAATHEGDLYQYAGIETLTNPLPPIVAVNTTAGTASEVTRHCVLTNTETKVKFVIVSWRNLPSVSINDPLLMIGKPAALTAATGMDALTHAIEAFVSVGAHPLTDANALEAIRLINLWLPKAVDDGHDLQAREQMAFGQYLAGMAFNSAGLGLVHALAHQPGATHNLPHGVCNAILLPIIENFNRPNAVARFARVAQAMGVDTRGMSDEAASMEAINAIRTLSKRVGIPQGFSQLGVSKADIEGWLDKALADPCAPCNPRPASRDEVRELYLEAL